jgi:hypothetical protein
MNHFDKFWTSTNNNAYFAGRKITVADLEQVARESWKTATVGSQAASELKDVPPGETRTNNGDVRVVIRLASPGRYHLIEVYQAGRGNAVIQIAGDCPAETVCAVASKIRGLGA